eukprot:36829-Rhodomonas_salina.1
MVEALEEAEGRGGGTRRRRESAEGESAGAQRASARRESEEEEEERGSASRAQATGERCCVCVGVCDAVSACTCAIGVRYLPRILLGSVRYLPMRARGTDGMGWRGSGAETIQDEGAASPSTPSTVRMLMLQLLVVAMNDDDHHHDGDDRDD